LNQGAMIQLCWYSVL